MYPVVWPDHPAFRLLCIPLNRIQHLQENQVYLSVVVGFDIDLSKRT